MELVELIDRINREKTKNVVQELYFDDKIPFCFENNPRLFYQFRDEICDFLKIHPQNFCIVGSAKTGFSLNTDKTKNRFGKSFDETSDIDLVLVSEEIFQNLWIELLDFQKNIVLKLDFTKKKNFNELQHIFFWGLIRFDKLTNDFPFAKEWWEFFNRLSIKNDYGPRRIRAGLYKSWYHVTLNYERNLNEIRNYYESICK